MAEQAEKEVWEIVNPSDPYTIVGEYKVVTIAVAMISYGYAVRNKAGKQGGLFFLGGFEKWCLDNGITNIEAFIKEHKQEIMTALDSVLIGSRAEAEESLKYILQDQQEKYLAERHDRERSSENDIGGYAKRLAKSLREAIEKERNGGTESESERVSETAK